MPGIMSAGDRKAYRRASGSWAEFIGEGGWQTTRFVSRVSLSPPACPLTPRFAADRRSLRFPRSRLLATSSLYQSLFTVPFT